MLVVPERAGPANPVSSTPFRVEGAVRRTTSIDSRRPDGLDRDVAVDARARDLATGPSSGSAWEASQGLRSRIAPDRTLLEIEAEPPEPRLSELLGTTVGPGFRTRMTTLLPDLAETHSLLYALLDDMPGAALVSGYALQRGNSGLIPTGKGRSDAFRRHILASEDMCSGWASSATIMVTFRDQHAVPTPLGPAAPSLDRPGDPIGWHAMDPLPIGATRRRRRLDLVPSAATASGWAFDSHFRDSYRDAQGLETVVHEYLVEGWLEEGLSRLDGVRAEARVLPWMECPAAIGSADRVAGRALADLRPEVRAEFVGTSTCTHLNDTFRFLSDLLPMVEIAGGAVR
ncbi:MAG: DUF2889 domain-containing protein [Acidimicrobiales bacterium]